MFLCLLAKFSTSWQTIKAHRLIQFNPYITNQTQFGSTRVSIDNQIGNISSFPSSKKAIITSVEDINLTQISSHIQVSSPILFLLPKSKPINTTALENFLINKPHKSAIYFTDEIQTVPSKYHYIKSSSIQTNSIKHTTILKNIFGTINLNENITQNVILLTASYNTFSAAPTLKVGASNGIVISSFLEIIRIISKFSLPQNFAFVFAFTSGRFCGMEGIEHFLDNQMFPIDFAISIESLITATLRGHLGMPLDSFDPEKKLKKGTDKVFKTFLVNFKNCLKEVQIPLEIKISDSIFSQRIFTNFDIPSISFSGGPLYSQLTDHFLNNTRADDFTWAFSEAMIRAVYNSPRIYSLIDKNIINTSYWSNAIATAPRLAPFIERSFAEVFLQWMIKFTDNATIDEWKSTNCYVPYSATDCLLTFYNPIPTNLKFLFIFASLIYGFLIYVFIAGFASTRLMLQKVKNHLISPFNKSVKKKA